MEMDRRRAVSILFHRTAALGLAAGALAACGLSTVDDLFSTAGAGGTATSSSSSSSASSTTGSSTSTSSSSTTASSSSTTSASSTASSSSSTTSSSSGSVCGDGVCGADESAVFCPQDCGSSSSSSSSTSSSGAPAGCLHSTCVGGPALDPLQCHDACVDPVCAQQATCCGNNSWDDSCQALAAQLCGADPCVKSVCAAMPGCCAQGWTPACVDKAKVVCQTACDCPHALCDQGDLLAATCSPCAAALCKADSYCCTSGWDGVCVAEVATVCGIACP
jgi:hypothetical protein